MLCNILETRWGLSVNEVAVVNTLVEMFAKQFAKLDCTCSDVVTHLISWVWSNSEKNKNAQQGVWHGEGVA